MDSDRREQRIMAKENFKIGVNYTFTFERLTEIIACAKNVKPKKLEVYPDNKVNEISFTGKKTVSRNEVLAIVSRYLHTNVSRVYKERFDQTVTFF